MRLDHNQELIGILRSKFKENGYLYNYYDDSRQNYELKEIKDKTICIETIDGMFGSIESDTQIPLEAFGYLKYFTYESPFSTRHEKVLNALSNFDNFALKLHPDKGDLVYIDMHMRRFGFFNRTSRFTVVYHFSSYEVLNGELNNSNNCPLTQIFHDQVRHSIQINFAGREYSLSHNDFVSSVADNSNYEFIFFQKSQIPEFDDCIPRLSGNREGSVMALSIL